jgi:hypothetical protein
MFNMIQLLDYLTLDICKNGRHYSVHTKAIGYGEYVSVPLEYREQLTPFSIDDAVNHIKTQTLSDDNHYINAYTYGHHGEEAHRWYVVAYITYERTDGREGILELQFAPAYPDVFPVETQMTLDNLYDTPAPDICNRILGDRGKLPSA